MLLFCMVNTELKLYINYTLYLPLSIKKVQFFSIILASLSELSDQSCLRVSLGWHCSHAGTAMDYFKIFNNLNDVASTYVYDAILHELRTQAQGLCLMGWQQAWKFGSDSHRISGDLIRPCTFARVFAVFASTSIDQLLAKYGAVGTKESAAAEAGEEKRKGRLRDRLSIPTRFRSKSSGPKSLRPSTHFPGVGVSSSITSI